MCVHARTHAAVACRRKLSHPIQQLAQRPCSHRSLRRRRRRLPHFIQTRPTSVPRRCRPPSLEADPIMPMAPGRRPQRRSGRAWPTRSSPTQSSPSQSCPTQTTALARRWRGRARPSRAAHRRDPSAALANRRRFRARRFARSSQVRRRGRVRCGAALTGALRCTVSPPPGWAHEPTHRFADAAAGRLEPNNTEPKPLQRSQPQRCTT